MYMIKYKCGKGTEGRTINMKKLYKSRKSRMLCGVCGGIGEYFDIDPTIVRLGFAVLVVCFGTGILAYIIAAIVVPNEPDGYNM